ncbi:bifunctional serine/threonine protein kinase/MFS transporter [Streptomyces vilmorinianum]|uniref:bifunctional serine/threonine protein kinase/MFS transporter n=1 Tax=Streptomyces vilmorinianum TaxID=3051092 RepID=UPI0010FB2401
MDQLIAEDPTRIGPYRLIARLGAGGMGLVYLGRSEGGRTVAVKVVQAEYAGHPEFRRRFAREVAAARRVGGSWTADVLDADPEADVPWVATQYIPGPDLHAVVAKDFGPLPEHSVRALANRLALALQAVHEAGLIHRDLKPSNVLVTVDGPRVIDFGIARAMDSLAGDSLHTHTGMLIGSPGFMSPEQVRGLELTPASDVFCLGAVVVYAATGRLLFGATDTGLNAHLFRVAEEEADLTGVPESLVDLVRACLHKDPAKRPTPQEVAARTTTDQATEWLPGAVLAQLGRHAAQLLDYAPVETPAARPAPQPQPQPQPLPPPPAYAPTAPAHFVPAQGFGPPPALPHPATVHDQAPPHPRRWWGLVVVALVQLMALLDGAVFSMAVPSIQADLGVPVGDLDSLYTAGSLAFGGLLLLGGHLADLVGRKNLLAVGLVGCAAAAAFGGSAGDADMLVWAHALQGVFAALVTPAALSLVAVNFTGPKERGRAFGVYAAIAAGGSALGLLCGGWLLEFLSWRLSLYAVIPVAVLCLIGTLTLLHDRPGRTRAGLDTLGALLGSGGLAALTYGLGDAEPRGWTDPLTVVLLSAGVLLLAAFLWWQTRTSSPLDRIDRVGCFLAMALTGVGVVTLFATLTFHLRNVLGYAPAATGVALLPLVGAAVIGSTQVSARLLHRVAPRVLIAAGLVLAAAGLLLLTPLDADSSYGLGLLPAMLLSGLGTGMAFMPVYATATAGVAPQHSGTTAATIAAAPLVGGAFGAALLNGIFADRVREVSGREMLIGELLRGHATTLWWGVGGVLLAGLIAGLMVTAKGARTANLNAN